MKSAPSQATITEHVHSVPTEWNRNVTVFMAHTVQCYVHGRVSRIVTKSVPVPLLDCIFILSVLNYWQEAEKIQLEEELKLRMLQLKAKIMSISTEYPIRLQV